MKLEFKIREIIWQGKKDDIVFDFDKKHELLSTFLSADVQSSSPYTTNALDKVLSGESDYEELSNNVCWVGMTKEKCTVYDKLAEDGMGNWCEIETCELRELVDIWLDTYKKFKENDNSLT